MNWNLFNRPVAAPASAQAAPDTLPGGISRRSHRAEGTAGRKPPRPGRSTVVPSSVYRLGSASAQMTRNFLVDTEGNVLAGYLIGSRRWEYTPLPQRESLITSAADVFGELAGRPYIESVTSRPYPVSVWAANLDRRTPRPLPDVEGGDETWNRHLARMQNRIAAIGMDDKVVFRYLGVGQVRPGTDLRAALDAYERTQELPPRQDVRAVIEEEKRVAEAVLTWRARRMSEREQAWLRVRSMARGIQPAFAHDAGSGSGQDCWGYDEQSLPALGDHIRWATEPFGRTMAITAFQGGVKIERAAMVLSVARMSDLHYPENGLEPWQTYADRAVDSHGRPFSVDWSINGELRTGAQMEPGAELDLAKAIALERDFGEHGEMVPAGLEEGIAVAKSTRDQVTNGRDVEAGRFVGTINAIVTGEALFVNGRQVASAGEVCEERAAALIRLYSGNEMRMELAAPQPQSVKLIEAVPGQARERYGYQCQVRFPYLAAGLPNISAAVGDGAGPYMGFSSRRAFMHDPHYATEGRGDRGRGNNFWVIAGALGAGKSILAALIAYNATRRNSRVVISDPSGPLLALCDLPEVKPYAQGIDLLKGRRGILSPPGLVREPLSSDFEAAEGLGVWEEACAVARAERKELVIDTARRCLDADMYESTQVRSVLREAARRVEWYVTKTLWDLVDALEEIGRGETEQRATARDVASDLRDAAEAPLLRLLFPPEADRHRQMRDVFDARLTVISTPGVRRAPDGVARGDWNPGEQAADVILGLVSLFTDRLIYTKARSEPCVVMFDEAENLTDYAPGRGFLQRLGRDHSKWNTAVYLMVKSINPQMLSGELRNFLAGAFVGRMANEKAAEEMLDVLNVKDKRYARTLMSLSEITPGEFVHADADGNVGGVRIDLEHLPALKAAVLTNPTPEGVEGWNTGVRL